MNIKINKFIISIIFIFFIILIFFNYNLIFNENKKENSFNNLENINLTIKTEELNLTENLNSIKKITNKSLKVNKINKLLKPIENKIYFSAFPDFGGNEDIITTERILEFEKLSNKKITWAYFSQNWYDGIKYPKEEINLINNLGIIPFVRFMPRSNTEEFSIETKFTINKIIKGDFDDELKRWANDAKKDNIPILVDFGLEMNGDWFSWSGINNGGNNKENYGDKNYPDGPEKIRDAYRHIINIFKEENVTTITWFFHINIYSEPDEWWNKPKLYYPGDDYIDWIGISIYGPLHPEENYWETFDEILNKTSKLILEISSKKPFAVLEFGVTDYHKLGNKSQWLNDAFNTILNQKYINFSAISYWHENWEENEGNFAKLRIDSSKESLNQFRLLVNNSKLISIPNISNYNYSKYIINNELNNDFKEYNLNQLKNEIYLPKPRISWQWQLSNIENINLNYDVELYDIDLFETSIADIKKLQNDGKKVICYFNAGAYEPYRKDSNLFKKEIIGKVMEGWEDEKWLDISKFEEFSEIMESRLDLAVIKGCNGVEPDNIDAYLNNNGFKLNYDDQIKYNIWLSEQAHKRNLSIALKNDLEQVKDLVKYFDFAINEECFYYNECDLLIPFINNNKAVLGVEYELSKDKFCNKANKLNFSWLKMNYDLDGERDSCIN